MSTPDSALLPPQSQLSVWIAAMRPKTLAAAFVPVLIGGSLAYSHDSFLALPTFAALMCAFLIQIGTNFANDYYDFKKGADSTNRIGFVRATSAGLIAPEKMLRATILTMAAAFVLGLYLVWHGGWVILLIGLLSILFGILYTGGPFPLGYNGLGDVFVFLFFGFVAVMGTYYLNTFTWSAQAFWASIAAGALCTNILVINNLRDAEEDRITGKKTLGVLFGDSALKIEYGLMLALAFAIPPHFFVQEGYNWQVLLPMALILPAAVLYRNVLIVPDKRSLNKTLEQTAQFMAAFGIFFSAGLVLGA
ncbi:MAG: 1,4-dihydroxy-2-naphthoate polyprenyltransferase [Candidatus Cyclonatronum sp.]|uniref:1,4-dihydroxy-2-naphthoate polyprenyltransferase n=1 Tax=Cyclonatronum sp. TaxID=3024185 RepID=UPI0025BAECA4|nr:1,4-dihydroxy-2-naphthoate polyprenyltransferase [Cyclonatronum sp.]MCH8485294.1 1,4-dihydroxy-2-naphthoate polyprenyltransferase [Cyclonatronum sp.]